MKDVDQVTDVLNASKIRYEVFSDGRAELDLIHGCRSF